MTQRERGAINMMWFISVIVLFLGAVGAMYVQNQDLTQAKLQVDNANRDKTEAVEARAKAIEDHSKLSNMVGFRAEGARFSTPESISATIEALRARYPNDIGQSDTSLDAIVDRLKTIADRWERVATETQQTAQTELAARTTAEQARDNSTRTVQEQLDQTNRDLGDSRNLLTQQQAQADTRQSELQRQIDDATVQKNEAESAAGKAATAAKTEIEGHRRRVDELAQKQKILGTDENPWAVDGKVISVGKSTGLAFIDIGSRDLLRGGVKFDVFRFAKGGEMVRKGTIEIRETFTDHSMGGILTEVNPLDPIAEGDVVSNPHFARNHTKVFVLLGNFPAYGREFLAQRLRDLGCEVQETVSAHTDFVVLGEKGTEEGAPEITDDAGYKLAMATGVQTMKLSDIERFIRP